MLKIRLSLRKKVTQIWVMYFLNNKCVIFSHIVFTVYYKLDILDLLQIIPVKYSYSKVDLHELIIGNFKIIN
jgi:hypothetical protein